MIQRRMRLIFIEPHEKGFKVDNIESEGEWVYFKTTKGVFDYLCLIVDKAGFRLVFKVRGMASDFKKYRQAIKVRQHYEIMWTKKQKHLTELENLIYNKYDVRKTHIQIEKTPSPRGSDLFNPGRKTSDLPRGESMGVVL